MFVFVLAHGWKSFEANGIDWFFGGGNVDEDLRQIFLSGQSGTNYVYEFHAWPIIWSTILITGGAVLIAFVASLFVAVFVVEFAPDWMKSILLPVVRLLASIPSVIY